MPKQQHFWPVAKIFYKMSTTCCVSHVVLASYLVLQNATCTTKVLKTHKTLDIIPLFIFTCNCLIVLIIIIVLLHIMLVNSKTIFPLFLSSLTISSHILRREVDMLRQAWLLMCKQQFSFFLVLLSPTWHLACRRNLWSTLRSTWRSSIVFTGKPFELSMKLWKNAYLSLGDDRHLHVYLRSSGYMDLYESVSVQTTCFISWAILVSLLSL